MKIEFDYGNTEEREAVMRLLAGADSGAPVPVEDTAAPPTPAVVPDAPEPTPPAAPDTDTSDQDPAPYGYDHRGRILDKHGYYHDPAVHSSSKKFKADGTWKKARGVSDADLQTALDKQDAENTPTDHQPGLFDNPTTQQPPAPPAPPAQQDKWPKGAPIPQAADPQQATPEEAQNAMSQLTVNHGAKASDDVLAAYNASSVAQIESPMLRSHLIQYITAVNEQLKNANS